MLILLLFTIAYSLLVIGLTARIYINLEKSAEKATAIEALLGLYIDKVGE